MRTTTGGGWPGSGQGGRSGEGPERGPGEGPGGGGRRWWLGQRCGPHSPHGAMAPALFQRPQGTPGLLSSKCSECEKQKLFCLALTSERGGAAVTSVGTVRWPGPPYDTPAAGPLSSPRCGAASRPLCLLRAAPRRAGFRIPTGSLSEKRSCPRCSAQMSPLSGGGRPTRPRSLRASWGHGLAAGISTRGFGRIR